MAVSKPEQLLPFLQVFQDEAERDAVAGKMFDYLATHRPLPECWSFGAITFGATSAVVAAGETEARVRGAHAG